jgi:hypothetical protein
MSYITGDPVITTKPTNGLGSTLQFSDASSSIFLGAGHIAAESLAIGQEKKYEIVGFHILAIDTRKDIPPTITNRIAWTSGLLTDMVLYNKPVDKHRLVFKFAEDIKKAMKEYGASLTDRDVYFHLVEQFRIEATGK